MKYVHRRKALITNIRKFQILRICLINKNVKKRLDLLYLLSDINMTAEDVISGSGNNKK